MPADTVWSDLQKLRETAPLVHYIANFVVMNNTANALLANTRNILAAGAHGVAVVSAVCSATDPAQAARQIRRQISAPRQKQS
jgi:hypothetical protein